MTTFLDKRQEAKNSKLHFNVLDVTYYEDSTFYLCEFKIKMTLPDGRDTTGMMKEKISKYTMTVQ